MGAGEAGHSETTAALARQYTPVGEPSGVCNGVLEPAAALRRRLSGGNAIDTGRAGGGAEVNCDHSLRAVMRACTGGSASSSGYMQDAAGSVQPRKCGTGAFLANKLGCEAKRSLSARQAHYRLLSLSAGQPQRGLRACEPLTLRAPRKDSLCAQDPVQTRLSAICSDGLGQRGVAASQLEDHSIPRQPLQKCFLQVTNIP